MEWYFAFIIIFGCLLVFMSTGMPIAFAFFITCILGSLLFWGGLSGLNQLAMSFFSSVTTFALLPIPLFVLMGNVIFEAGVGMKMVNAVERMLGRLPGRLGILAIGAGALLGTMIGISGGTIAILGRSLVPEMHRLGYKNEMSLGPVVASGTLATLIPPSALAVFLGAMAKVSIGKLLIAIVIPGFMLAALFSIYIIVRCLIQPSLAPVQTLTHTPWKTKIVLFLRYILPIGIVIFAAIGVVFIGIATPSEAAALGAVACLVLAALYRSLTFNVIKRAAGGTVEITVMVFMIIVGSMSFSRILSSSGAISGLVELTMNLPVHPMFIVVATQMVAIFLGCFMDASSIIMITIPMFMPMIKALGFDPVWYSTLLIINIQLGMITPPFGLDCYTMRALAPEGVSIGDVFRSSTPFLLLGFLMMLLIMAFPGIALWLPSIMAK